MQICTAFVHIQTYLVYQDCPWLSHLPGFPVKSLFSLWLCHLPWLGLKSQSRVSAGLCFSLLGAGFLLSTQLIDLSPASMLLIFSVCFSLIEANWLLSWKGKQMGAAPGKNATDTHYSYLKFSSFSWKKKKAFPFAVCIWLNSREPKWLFLAVWSNYIFTFGEEDLPTSFGHARSSLEGFPGGSEGKESACNVEDLGSIPGLGRSPGKGKGYPLQYSGLENSMDCIVHGLTKSRTWLNNLATISSLSSFDHRDIFS